MFRSRLRLLPLAIALAAVGITFGATSLLGGSLTIASIAVLPILIGLAVDYAIQFQSRVQEARRSEQGAGLTAERAIARAASLSMPTIATAALATATGFLVLLLSPVPMVRGFGVLLVVGIVIALACALMSVSAAMALAERDGGVVWASLRGAYEIVAEAGSILAGLAQGVRRVAGGLAGPARRVRTAAGSASRATLGAAVRQPGRVLAVAAVLAVLGWVADTQTSVQSDVTKLVPSSMPALQRPPSARARHGRVRRDRRGRPLAGRRDAEDDRLDAVLREQAPVALRVPRVEGLLEGHAVPGAVAARPVLLGHAADGERMRRADRGLDQARC